MIMKQIKLEKKLNYGLNINFYDRNEIRINKENHYFYLKMSKIQLLENIIFL